MSDLALALKNYREGQPLDSVGGSNLQFKTPKVQQGFTKTSSDLQKAVSEFPGQLTLTSTLRDKGTNKAVGGVKNSFHLSGDAVDIRTQGRTPHELSEITNHFTAKGFQVINEGDHLHVEPSGRKETSPSVQSASPSGEIDLAQSLAQYRQDKGLPPVEMQSVQEDPSPAVAQVAQAPSTLPIEDQLNQIKKEQGIQAAALRNQLVNAQALGAENYIPPNTAAPLDAELQKIVGRSGADEELYTGITTGLNTAMFSVPEKITSAGEAVLGSLGLNEAPAGFPEEAGIIERFLAESAENRGAIKTLVDRNPKSALAGQIAGTVLGPLSKIKALQGPGIVNTLARGGLEGVAAELGEGGDLSDAAVGGVTGAGVSGGLKGVGAGLSFLGKKGFEKAVGQGGVGEQILSTLGLKHLLTKKGIQKAGGKYLNTSDDQINTILTKNIDKSVPLPNNMQPGDLNELADYFLRNEDLVTALRLEQIGNKAAKGGGLNPIDADFVQKLYGNIARTDSGVKGSVKAKVYEERRRQLRKSIVESLNPDDQKAYNAIKSARQAFGGTLKKLKKIEGRVPNFGISDVLLGYLTGGLTVPYTLLKNYPATGAVAAKAGKALENQTLIQILNQAALSGL